MRAFIRIRCAPNRSGDACLGRGYYRDGRILTNHRQADGQRAPRRDGTASWTHFSEFLGHYHTWCGSVSDKSEQKWFKIGGTLGGTRIWPGLFLGPDSTILTVSPRNNQIHKFKEYFRWAVFSCGSFWCLWKSPIFSFCWVTDTNLDLFAFFSFLFFVGLDSEIPVFRTRFFGVGFFLWTKDANCTLVVDGSVIIVRLKPQTQSRKAL